MEPDHSRIWIYAVVLAVAVLLRGWMAACESAVTEVKDGKVRGMEEQNPAYRRLAKLIDRPQKLLLSFAMHRSLSIVLISVLSVLVCDAAFGDRIMAAAHSAERIVLRVGVIAVLSAVVSCLLTVLTELFPKRLVEKNTERFALRNSGAVGVMIALMTPFAYASYGLNFVFCKLFGLKTTLVQDTVTEEEIRLLVDAGNETGAIEESEREMINNIFEFDDVTVADVMTHRTDFVSADISAKIGDIVYLAINEGFSRIPVYEGTVDSILGIIYVKDLLCLVGCEHCEDFTLRNFLREVLFVPDTGKCRDVFQQMRREKQHMAIVVDEYGGTAGLVTMEDLLEEIVGNIQDEYDDEAADLEQIAETEYIVDGAADPEEILPKLGATIPEENCYETMSGLVVDILGRIPTEGETPSVEYQSLRLTVLETEDNWISKLRVERCDQKPAALV
ncbi:MAG: HlyC/CorC family transporter [Ruminococcus sp.]|nr:HlyC/CorC family transporter [Ruminococcus sp.]